MNATSLITRIGWFFDDVTTYPTILVTLGLLMLVTMGAAGPDLVPGTTAEAVIPAIHPAFVYVKDTMLPFLFVAQVVLMVLAVRTAARAGKWSGHRARPLYAIIALLALWAPISAYLAIQGAYTSPAVLEKLPGLWVTMVPVLLLMVPWGVSAGFRDSINELIDAVGLHRVVLFEGLRILAIGGIIKALRGEFSSEIGLYSAGLDLIFGALSLLAGYLLYRKSLDLKWVLALNVYGFVIIVPATLVLMNLGIPGPWHIIHSTPDMVSMYEYPMALAPTVVVPIFIVINGFIINYVLSHKGAGLAN